MLLTHLDAYSLDSELNGAIDGGGHRASLPWQVLQGLGFARCCFPFLWNTPQHPWAASTPFLQGTVKPSPALGEGFGSSAMHEFCAISSSQKVKARRQNVIWAGLIHIYAGFSSSFGAWGSFLLDFWGQTFSRWWQLLVPYLQGIKKYPGTSFVEVMV